MPESKKSESKKSATVRILFVCLGNICRSPTAEGVMRQLLAQDAPDLPADLDSAGTGDYHLGAAPDLRSQRAAALRGIDISGLRARQVGRADFHSFDYILAMDSANLAALTAMQPPGSRAVLKLFLDFAPQSPVREVPDPYCLASGAFENVLDLTEEAARGLLTLLQKPP